MSLIAWWPLSDGSLKNLVDDSNPLNAGLPYTAVRGKIGVYSYYNPAQSNSGGLRSTKEVALGQTQSMFCWIYVSEYPWLSGIITNHNHSSPTGMGLTMNDAGNICVNTASIVSCSGSSQETNGFRTYFIYRSEGIVPKNQWCHVGYTFNNGALSFYINGVQQKVVFNGTNTNQYEYSDIHLKYTRFGQTTINVFGWSTAFGEYGLKGNVCDVRIYNHALSKKEVQELSKALVLHYPLTTPINTKAFTITANDWQSNKDASGAANGAGTAAPLSDGSVLITSNNQNTRLRWGTFPYLTAGQKYTVSIKYKQVSGDQTFRWQIQERSTAGGGSVYETYWTQDTQKEIQLANGWKIIYYHLTIKNNCYGMFWLQEGADYVHYTQQYYLKDFCVEKGHTTSPGSNTSSTVIGDGSGLGNDGTLTLPDYYETVYDSKLGRNTLYSKGYKDAFIHTKLVPLFISGTGTICFWYKKDSASTNFLVATPYQGSSSGTYLWANQPSSTPWNGGSTSYSSWYIDGVERKSNAESNTDWHFYCITGVNISAWNSFTIHDHGDDGWLYRGKISDFRVYNTILSEADIKELYNIGWAANRQGQIFSYVTNEGQPQFQITRGGVNNCNNLVEIGNVPSDYTPVEYIQFSGSEYIDTNYTPTHNMSTALIFSASNYANNSLFIYGAGVASGDRAWELYPWNDGLQFNYGTAYNLTTVPAPTSNLNTKVLAVQNKTKFSAVYNTAIYTGTHSVNSFIAPYTLYIGALHRSSAVTFAGKGTKLNVYGMIIHDNDIIVRNFIPVQRKSDNVAGLYDTVNNVFYANSGSGTIVAGPKAVSQSRNGSLYCAEFNEI